MEELSGYYVLDSEGNGLDKGAGKLPDDITQVYCVVMKDMVSKATFHFDMFQGWDDFRRILYDAKMVVAHNIIDFDLPVFGRLLNAHINPSCIVVDTLVWSRALYPDRVFEGGHGLEAWGERNGIPKPPIEDWSKYTPDVLDRCYQDVENNYMTFMKLSQEASMYESGPFLWTEQQISGIVSKQCKRGHAFNISLATWLKEQLEEWLSEIDKGLARHMRPKPKMCYEPVKKIRNKNNDYSQYVLDWYGDELEADRQYGPVQPHRAFEILSGVEEGEPVFCRIEWPDPNFGSNQQMIRHLLDFGWVPVEYTDKGNPKITDESLEILISKKGVDPVLKQLCKRRVVASRYGMVKGWLENINEDGRIRGGVNPQGAVTLRMTHSTVVNVPKYKPDERYSEFYRMCFESSAIPEGEREWDEEWTYTHHDLRKGEDEEVTVKGRMAQVGCDASGLENRMLAHFLNDPALTEKIIQDFHTLIWNAVDTYLDSRDSTKNWEYAFFYGAADLKLGVMLDTIDEVTEDDAYQLGWKQLTRGKNAGKWTNGECKPVEWRLVPYIISGGRSRALIAQEIPELGELIDWVKETSRQGYVELFDKRRLIMRRGYDGGVMTHKSLNTLLQGAGALVMKAAQVMLSRWLAVEHIDAHFINTVHDEFQLECYPSDRFRVAQLAEESIRWAGRHFNLNCPLDAEAKIGLNWGETH